MKFVKWCSKVTKEKITDASIKKKKFIMILYYKRKPQNLTVRRV